MTKLQIKCHITYFDYEKICHNHLLCDIVISSCKPMKHINGAIMTVQNLLQNNTMINL